MVHTVGGGLAQRLGVGELLRKVLRESTPVYLLEPTSDMLADCILELYTNASEYTDLPTPVRVISTDCDSLFERFRIRYQTVELAQAGVIEVREVDELTVQTAEILSEAVATTLIQYGNTYVIIPRTDDPFHSPDPNRVAVNYAEDRWPTGDEHLPETSMPWNELIQSLRESTSDDLVNEFRGLLDVQLCDPAANTLKWVDLLLLAAARTNETQSSLSRWGEETGLVTDSTISRYKRTLSEQDIIRSRPLTGGRGRPKSELFVPDRHLRGLDTSQFYHHVVGHEDDTNAPSGNNNATHTGDDKPNRQTGQTVLFSDGFGGGWPNRNIRDGNSLTGEKPDEATDRSTDRLDLQ